MNETPKKPKVAFGHWPMGAPVPLTREMIYDEDGERGEVTTSPEPDRTEGNPGPAPAKALRDRFPRLHGLSDADFDETAGQSEKGALRQLRIIEGDDE